MATLSPLTFITIALFILTAATPSSSSSSSSSSSPVSEIETLLKFKSLLKDPLNVLSNWSINSPLHHCNWTGIECGGGGPDSLSVSAISFTIRNLSGEISPSVCDLPYLTYLNLEGNLFKTPFPDVLKCKSLRTLWLGDNQFYGEIPDGISQLSSLVEFDMLNNRIERIPQSIGHVKTLKWLHLGSNNLSGSIAHNVLGNMSALTMLDLSENPSLVSELPRDIGKLENHRDIYFQGCGFYGVIPESYDSGLPGLESLDLSRNKLTGMIPKSLVLNKNWTTFDVSQNRFFGSLPIGNIFNKGLTRFGVHSNKFNGSLPKDGIDECLQLETFEVQNNDFEGEFLNGVWSLPNITVIRAENNRFTGEIPRSVSNAVRLQEVQIDNNNFTGKIPSGLGMIKGLFKFSASSNGFYGEIPSSLCDSSGISTLNLSNNLLFGEIPELKKCTKLVSLSLADNGLVGDIPPSLGALLRLTYIDLSSNWLTGSIPQELENLNLTLFNVSFNRLSGLVPSFLATSPQDSFLPGNDELCGPGLPRSCPIDDSTSGDSSELVPLIDRIFFVCIVLTIALTVCAVFLIKSRQKFKARHVSGEDIGEEEITGDEVTADDEKGVWKSHGSFIPPTLTENNLRARMKTMPRAQSSSFGRYHTKDTATYGLLAVKKLVKPPTSSAISSNAGIKRLAEIRHKNIATMRGLWYTDKEAVVVYNHVEGGSLGDLISRPGFDLSWEARLNIAIGVAQGLAYLHKDCVPPILHRNVKSKNILLGDDDEPMLTDYALDRIVGEVAFQTCMLSSAPSCYLAPETPYAKNATEKMDVFSFGVVLLELVTGQQAEPTESKDSLDIVQWALGKIREESMMFQVVDPGIAKHPYKQQIFGALEIALSCVSDVPAERPPSMSEVVENLVYLSTDKMQIIWCRFLSTYGNSNE